MDLEALLRLGIDVLRQVPLIMIFYIPALFGMAILREQGENYKVKAGLMLALGFGAILVVHLVLRLVSVEQVLATLGISLLQMAVALGLAAVTVYKLAD
ncbi:hypothetical protein [Rubrobacter aplysinae]|uniref:hypothetical protein n=1 Tax=Rubrobacter aplysinae TaxID=909625 RepID=UPI00128BE32D|nr:hypothetical protein [Rubrobacter aplysinae]